MTTDELHSEMINGFKKVAAEFAKMRSEMIDRFEKVDVEFAKIRAEMKTEGETTRRHFEIWAERVNDSVKIVAEATAHHSVRI